MAKKDMDNTVLDKRVVSRYIQRGVLSDKDYQKYLKELPDLEPVCDTVVIDEISSGDNGASADPGGVPTAGAAS